jgi:hypothetical protein
MIDEEIWERERNVIFVTDEVLDIMEKAKFKVESVKFPYQSQIFMMPKTSDIDSCLVTIGDYDLRVPIAKKININLEGENEHPDDNKISIVLWSKRISIDTDSIKEFLETGKLKTMKGAMPLDDEENRYMAKILRAVMGIALYVQCNPGKLIEGYPEAKPKNKKLREGKARIFRIEGIRQSSSKASHYRTGHFRFLQHERYKKPRMIFVKGTFVGKKVNPKTVVK